MQEKQESLYLNNKKNSQKNVNYEGKNHIINNNNKQNKLSEKNNENCEK